MVPIPRSLLESLPVELLDLVISSLDHRSDVARLVSCSKSLYSSLRESLWHPPENHNAALHWGCKTGEVRIIQLAVEYGASPDFIQLPPYEDGRLRPAYPPLYIVAKHGHVCAFTALLELGAHLRGPDRTLVRHVCASMGHDDSLLRVFMKELERQHFQLQPSHMIPVTTPVYVSELLVRFIQAGAPLDILRSLLDDWGANPNNPQACEKPTKWHKDVHSLTPLAAAIFVGSAPIFELLISRGAAINGTNTSPARPSPELALDVPVLAAANAMACVPGGRAMMELVLAHGANINPPVSVPAMKYYALGRMQYFWARNAPLEKCSPLSMMIGSFCRWAVDDGGPEPAEMYEFLLSRGARPADEAGISQLTYSLHPGTRRGRESGSWLFRRDHDMPVRDDPRVRAFTKVVLEHGTTLEELRDLAWRSVQPRIRGGEWCGAFFSEEDLNDSHWTQADRTDQRILEEQLAARFTAAEAASALQEHLQEMPCSLMEPWGNKRQCVHTNWYLSRGIDINAVGAGVPDLKPTEPPLWIVCRLLKEKWTAEGWDRWGEEHETTRYRDRVCEYVRFLLLKGADPYLEIGGKTVFDVLYEGIDQGEQDDQVEGPNRISTKGTGRILWDQIATLLRGGGDMDWMILCPGCEGHLVDRKCPDVPIKGE